MRKLLSLSASLSAAAVLMSYATDAPASAFALIEQSVKGLGNAYAGSAAAEDATTVFFNPAGLTRLKGSEIVLGAHYIKPSAKFSDGGSHISSALGGAALTGGDGGDASVPAVVPNFYYALELGGGYHFGVGVNAPFGLATEYDSDWKGRYQALKSEIKTININPTFAFKTGELSLGIGASWQSMEAELTQTVDFSVACLGTFGGPACAAAGLATPQSASTDGSSNNTADDTSWGYNVGLLYELSPQTRFGLAYRSKMKYKLEGDGDFALPAVVDAGASVPAATLKAVFADSAITSDITLPETVSLSAFHQLTPQWAIMGDIARTYWDRIPELRIDFANTLKSDGVEALNWEKTWRYSVGLNYLMDSAWTLRLGAAVDQTPIPTAESRTARLPDSDRKWLAVGASYKPAKDMTVDLGYAHLFMSDADINRTGALGDLLTGKYKNSVDILSAQLVWDF